MSKICCKLFGVPQITKDGQNIFLPYAKVNALLYYILVTKTASRDEISGLLWPDENGDTAKKNLRNAVYQAKKALGEDIILSPKKSFLLLNENLDIETDVDLFHRSPRKNIHLYTGDFLQGFFLKDSESYEYWTVRMRNFYQERFTSECYLKIKEDIQNKHYDEVESYIQRLIGLDEYNERNIRLLMRFYQDTGRNNKVIETYYDLSKLLRRDLGIDPDKKTQEIYKRSLERINYSRNKPSYHENAFFFGRYEEIALSEKALKSFQEKKEGRSLLITGEAGMGKSTLKRRLLEESAGDSFVLEASCYQVEKDLPLRPWRTIAREISRQLQGEEPILPPVWGELMRDLFPDFGENLPDGKFITAPKKAPLQRTVHIMAETLTRLASKKQVFLVFEDIQWMDTDSLQLLTAVLLEIDPLLVMLIATHNKEHSPPVEDAFNALRRYHRLVTIALEPFHIEACHHFIVETMPDKKLEGEMLERIYTETGGNPLFLAEYVEMMKTGVGLDTMSPAMLEAIQGRFLYLSSDAMELAGILSFFNAAVQFSFLPEITGKSEPELLPPLEELMNRNILAEKDCAICFTHTKLREYLYMTQSAARKKILHQKIGLLLEGMLDSKKKDSRLFSRLIYHFSAAGDDLNALKYRVALLSGRLNFSHEMFPILSGAEPDSETDSYVSRAQIGELFRNLEAAFQKIPDCAKTAPEWALLEVEFFYMKGRYLIREGNYEEGVNNITYVIDRSKQINNRDYMLEGYKQMILYHLQIDNPKDMREYVEKALDLAVKCNYHKEIGVILRLKGLYNIMTGNYSLAEKFLYESINTLSVTEDVASDYAINIAAAYNYIGEIRQAEGNYTKALQLFEKAISLCLERNALASLSYFYINIGKTAYYMGNVEKAREYFEKAYSLYGEFDSFWRRSALDSYMALNLIRERRCKDALKYLATARRNVDHIKDPNDLGIVLFAQALIRKMSDEDPEIGRVFGASLTKSADVYCRLAQKNLNKYCNRYEITVLQQLFAH